MAKQLTLEAAQRVIEARDAPGRWGAAILAGRAPLRPAPRDRRRRPRRQLLAWGGPDRPRRVRPDQPAAAGPWLAGDPVGGRRAALGAWGWPGAPPRAPPRLGR